MTSKIVGALALFFAVTGGALLARLRDGERLVRVDALLDFLRFVRLQLERYLATSAEIVGRADDKILENCLIGCPMDAIASVKDVDSFAAAVRTSHYRDGCAEIDDFASRFGSSFRDDELKNCDECIEALMRISESLRRELPQRRRTAAVIGLCAAGGIIIFLI